jgi:hypothetical protein
VAGTQPEKPPEKPPEKIAANLKPGSVIKRGGVLIAIPKPNPRR